MYATAAPTAPAMPSLYMTPQGAPPQPALPSYGSAFGPSPLMAATYGAPTNGIGAATPMSFRPAASFGATALYGPTGFDASAVLDPSAERIRQLTAQVAFLENKGNELTRQLNESYDLVRPHGEAARCRHGWRVVCVCVWGERGRTRWKRNHASSRIGRAFRPADARGRGDCHQVNRQTRDYDHASVRLQVDERELARLQDMLEQVTRRQRNAHETEMLR